MGVGTGLYIYDVVEKSSRSLSHLLMSSCNVLISSKCKSQSGNEVHRYVAHATRQELSVDVLH